MQNNFGGDRMAKVITLGEIMMRLSPPGNERFIQAGSFDINFGGGEANVAVSLANYGHRAEFVTKIPDNPIGECAASALRKYGVGTEHIVRGGERLGIYFLENGSAIRASNVVYDRANSAISKANPNEFDFDAIFKDADWFHFTGITPALSDSAEALVEAACKAAKRHGVTVSCDVNYRKKLWAEQKAKSVMSSLMQYVDVCIDGDRILGFNPKGMDFSLGVPTVDEYKKIFSDMAKEYEFKYVAASMRVPKSASDNLWSACIYCAEDNEIYHSTQYRFHPITDRVGGGDSFVGGLICGLLDGKNYKDALEFGAAATALKHTIPGDVNLATRSEVEGIARGNSSGSVQR